MLSIQILNLKSTACSHVIAGATGTCQMELPIIERNVAMISLYAGELTP